MIESITPLTQLVTFTARKRAASLTGSLVGLSLPERDVILSRELAEFEAQLAAAVSRAAELGEPVDVDGSGISLTDGGDTWTVHPDGRMTRRFDKFTGFEDFLGQVASRPAVDMGRSIDREHLLEAAYQGFWSPSATNWQPMRLLEVDGACRDALCALAGWTPPSGDFPMLVVLRRDHYESLLGDVLEPFGLEVTAREESIDAGIFTQTLILSALAQGLTADEFVFEAPAREAARDLVKVEVARRIATLDTLEVGADPAHQAREQATLRHLLDFLERAKYYPDALVAIGHPLGPVTPYPDFGRLVAEHSTQRVASPHAEFGHEAMMRLWDLSRDTLPEGDRPNVKFADFSWHEQVPARIGKAMFESLYGIGADPDTKAGGEGGILTAVTAKNFLVHTAKSSPEYIAAHMPAGWQDLDDAELRKVAREMPVREQDLGRFLCERILRDGKYRIEGGMVVEGEGKALSVPLLVRMMKSLAGTFGNFFLKFQNTHPQNAVLLADTGAGDVHLIYRSVGKAAAVLTFLSRAQGASSIIKSGPIDLARDPIAQILAENPDDLPHLRPWREPLLAGAYLPAMTFQVGMPLAGSDVIEAGTPNEHTGLEERKRDKRPPREDFTWHYLPVV